MLDCNCRMLRSLLCPVLRDTKSISQFHVRAYIVGIKGPLPKKENACPMLIENNAAEPPWGHSQMYVAIVGASEITPGSCQGVGQRVTPVICQVCG